MSAQEKANLVNMTLTKLNDTGASIKILTFDGTAANFSMARCLGANLSADSDSTFLKYPVNNDNVHIFLDAAHMLKLCRNALGDWKQLFDENENPIKWQYFEKLVAVQDGLGLHFATKIRNRHINYFKEKMKVRLAAQTFSQSVADAMTYCKNNLKLTDFNNCASTITFCININNIFDFLNTRNYLSKAEYKKPLKLSDNTNIQTFIQSSISYLQNLKCKDVKQNKLIPLVQSSRKTGFVGLILCLRSISHILNQADMFEDGHLEYLLTYKLSQDHLEMFFSAVRARGGFSNNPTAAQFEAAYKRLIIHTEIMTCSEGANCMNIDLTPILSIGSTKKKQKPSSFIDIICYENGENDVDDNFDDIKNDLKNVLNNFDVDKIDMCVTDIVEYIAGFVVKKLKTKINCNECVKALLSDSSNNFLLNIKNQGRLIKPSTDVVKLCKLSETIFKSHQNEIKCKKDIISYLTIKASSKIQISTLFSSLSVHILDQSPLDNHLLQIVTFIFKTYFTLRLHHHNKTLSQPTERIRSHLTKTIHFKGQ